jgi:hypothetical protein
VRSRIRLSGKWFAINAQAAHFRLGICPDSLDGTAGPRYAMIAIPLGIEVD